MKISALKIALGILLLLSSTINSFAAVVQSLTMPFTVEYEDNPLFLTSQNKISEKRVTFTPSYSLTSNIGANQLIAGASIRVVRSSDTAVSQDRNDPTANLGWTHSYETGSFSVNANMNDQSTRVSEFSDSGLVSGDNTRKTRTLSLNWLNELSQKTSLSLGGTATEVTFDGLATTGLVNFRNDAVNTRLNYSHTDNLSSYAQLSFSRYNGEDINNTQNNTKNFDLGLTYTINQKLNVSSSVGVSETITKSDVLNSEKSESWQGSLSMQYATLLTTTNISLSRSQLPASTGSLNETNQASMSWNYNLSEKENLGFDYSWRENLTINKAITQQYLAKYSREISLSWGLSLTAIHKIRESEQLDSRSSNVIMASIVYNISDF